MRPSQREGAWSALRNGVSARHHERHNWDCVTSALTPLIFSASIPTGPHPPLDNVAVTVLH